MADYNTALEPTLKNEGWYANVQGDSGLETIRGVSRKFFPHWPGWPIVDSYKSSKYFPKILEGDEKLSELINEFYRTNFWNPIRGDEINSQPIANALFDDAVNSGTGAAIKKMQATLGILETGVMGDATLLKLNS